jgi:MFS family permease
MTYALAGLSGSAPVVCGTAVISDLFDERDRASAMAVYTLGCVSIVTFCLPAFIIIAAARSLGPVRMFSSTMCATRIIFTVVGPICGDTET